MTGHPEPGADITSPTQSLEESLTRLSTEQIRFISARLNAKNDKEAARLIGLSPNRFTPGPAKPRRLFIEHKGLIYRTLF